MHRQPKASAIFITSILIILIVLPAWALGGGGGQARRRGKARGTAKTAIRITTVPPKGGGPDSLDTIAGTVSGVKTESYKVIIFAHTDRWYVQPYIDAPDTSIGSDGKWESDTHLGLEYAALLVKPSYKPPATAATLPAVGGAVLAIARERARQ
jgi:hypothetical protein